MAFKINKNKQTLTKSDPQYAQKLNEMIKQKAQEICQKRGCTPGRELDDWLEAERFVKKQMNIR